MSNFLIDDTPFDNDRETTISPIEYQVNSIDTRKHLRMKVTMFGLYTLTSWTIRTVEQLDVSSSHLLEKH